MNSLRGIFPEPKTIPKRNFILENKRKLRDWVEKNEKQLRKLNDSKGTSVQGDKTMSTKRSGPIKLLQHGNSSRHSNKSNPERCRKQFSSMSTNLKKGTVPMSGKVKVQNSAPAINKIKTPISISRSSSPDYSKFAGNSIGKAFRSKAIQTVDINDMEALLNNSIIRYATAKPPIVKSPAVKSPAVKSPAVKSPTVKSPKLSPMKSPKSPISVKTIRSPSPKVEKEIDTPATTIADKENENNTNIKPIVVRPAKPPLIVKPVQNVKDEELRDPLKAPSNYQKGVLPKYLRNRKPPEPVLEEDKNCPEGHVCLPDCERRDTLAVIRKRFAELVSELNKMPLRADTFKQTRRKSELEDELRKLEDGIKVFTRPRVYVKISN